MHAEYQKREEEEEDEEATRAVSHLGRGGASTNPLSYFFASTKWLISRLDSTRLDRTPFSSLSIHQQQHARHGTALHGCFSADKQQQHNKFHSILLQLLVFYFKIQNTTTAVEFDIAVFIVRQRIFTQFSGGGGGDESPAHPQSGTAAACRRLHCSMYNLRRASAPCGRITCGPHGRTQTRCYGTAGRHTHTHRYIRIKQLSCVLYCCCCCCCCCWYL